MTKGAQMSCRPIPAAEILPSFLQSLIPVSTPAFIGIDGNAWAIKTAPLPFVEENFLEFTIKDNLPLQSAVVKEAKKLGWQYLYEVAEDKEKIVSQTGYTIRGC